MAALALFYVWPVANLVTTVVRPGAIGRIARQAGIGRVLWFTTWQALISTAATLIAGLGPAYFLARVRWRGRRLITAIVTVPFMLPTVVVGAAFSALLPDSLQPSVVAIIAAHVYFNIAVVVRVIGTAAAVIPNDLLGAARTLGAGPGALARHVLWPMLRPSIAAAAAVVFVFTFTSFGVVRLLGGPARPTLEVEIARRATQLGDINGAVVLSMLQLVVLGTVLWWSGRVVGRRGSVSFTGAAGPQSPPRPALVRIGALAIAVPMVLPAVALVVGSFRVDGGWSAIGWTHLGSDSVLRGLRLGVQPLASLLTSLRVGLIAASLSVLLGGLASHLIGARRRLGRWVDTGLLLPLGTSAITVGLGLLITFDQAPFDWRASPMLVPIGHALVAAPFVVRTVLPALQAVPTDVRAAAATLGASPLRTWWNVDARIARRPLVVAWGLAAAISFGEFGAATLLSRTGNDTAPIAIARLLGRAGGLPRTQGLALATLLLLVTGAIVAACSIALESGDA